MTDNNKTIKFEIPSVKDYSRILRLAAAGAADTCGFDVDMIEDVKVIVSEVFGSIIEAGEKSAHMSFLPEAGRLTVEIFTCSGKPVLDGANEMTLPILQALAGSVDEIDKGGLRLVMER